VAAQGDRNNGYSSGSCLWSGDERLNILTGKEFSMHKPKTPFFIRLSGSLLVIAISLNAAGAFAQNQGHRYPRMGIFYWGGAHAAYYRNFDLVDFNRTDPNFAREIKSYNPDIILLPTTDWNAGGGVDYIPPEWVPVNSKGEKIKYREYDQTDLTNYCLPYNGKKFNEYLPEFLVQRIDLTAFNGIATDGVYDCPREGAYKVSDIDLDRNGVNDMVEYGLDWVKSQFVAGIEKICNRLHDLMPEGSLLLLNSGRLHTFAWHCSNGLVLEYVGDPINWDWSKRMMDKWMASALEPHILLYDGRANYSRYQPTPSRNHYRLMRFQMTTALLFDCYWSFTDLESRDHNYIKYYDEYDLDLGYPTTASQQLPNGCWIRFFDLGCSIVNPTGQEKTVTDADLASMTGYAGPYYRFRGGQQPEHNTGEPFTSITLFGQRDGSNDYLYGDGIILLTEPKDVVCEIIIDDVHPGTNPGSYPAVLEGEWVHDAIDGGGYYCLADRPWKAYWRFAYSKPGTGNNRAIYTPTIGVAGYYEVFEWHGYLSVNPDATQEGDNVPYTITYSKGVSRSGTIDQSVNYGQWNSLGTYWFDEGSSGNVTITNNANGYILADAFKFVYHGKELDTTPPNAPENLRSESSTGNTLTIAWDAPLPAADGDEAVAYQVFRSNTFVGSPSATVFTDEGLSESTTYEYMVYSLDKAGNRSQTAATGFFATAADNIPPTLVSVDLADLSTLDVLFSEPVEQASAENISNFRIESDISIFSASLKSDLRTVRLNTSMHVIGAPYSLIVNNVRDRAMSPNTIAANSGVNYIGSGGDISIWIAGDDGYELYVNDVFVGEGSAWNVAQHYVVSSIAGDNVVGVKCVDRSGEGGLVAEIDFNGKHYVTNDTWKVSSVEYANWQNVDYDDVGWQKATSYGLHGEALPWAQYQNVQGISTDNNAEWIWSSDSEYDDVVYFRFTIGTGGDVIPPNPPVGVTITQQSPAP
jgi:hypothetical protein